MDHRQLCLAAAGDDPHHPVSLAESLGARPACDDLAGELKAGDVLGCAGWRGIRAPALHHVGAVQPRRPDAHQRLAGARDGIGVIFDRQVGVANRDGAHRCG